MIYRGCDALWPVNGIVYTEEPWSCDIPFYGSDIVLPLDGHCPV